MLWIRGTSDLKLLWPRDASTWRMCALKVEARDSKTRTRVTGVCSLSRSSRRFRKVLQKDTVLQDRDTQQSSYTYGEMLEIPRLFISSTNFCSPALL